MGRATLLLLGWMFVVPSRPAGASPPTLARRGLLGARVGELAPRARSRSGPQSPGGVVVLGILPGTPAGAAGIRADDVILSVDGAPVDGVAQYLRAVGRRRSGDELRLDVRRAERRLSLAARLTSLPFERSSRLDVSYGAVRSGGALLRTIVVGPRGAGPHPAVLLIQGLGCDSVDYPLESERPYRRLVYALAERGFITMRVEKSGAGDSTGTRCDEVGFEEEARGFGAGLERLRSLPGVDPTRVFVLGHSMGGVMAPMLDRGGAVRGIIALGTVVRPWIEYELENRRRQGLLKGLSAPALEEHLRRAKSFFTALGKEGLSPRALAARSPELRDLAGDGEHVYGRAYRFFVELSRADLRAEWERVSSRVLAVWGTSDYISSPTDHELLVAIVNRRHPGHATLFRLGQLDHAFRRVGSMERSFRGEQDRALHPELVPRLERWMRTGK